MRSKKSRAPQTLRLNLDNQTPILNNFKTFSPQVQATQQFLSIDSLLKVDEHVWTSGVKLAQDERFLKQNKITHVVNCVSQGFPSPSYLGI